MLRVGFLNELVSHDDLQQTVDDYQKSILECDSSVSSSMKRNIDAFVSGSLNPEIWIQKYREALTSKEMARRLGKNYCGIGTEDQETICQPSALLAHTCK